MSKKLIVYIFILFCTALNAQELVIQENVKFLALGDSYTIGQSVAPADRWPVQLIERLKKHGITCDELKIIATTGWGTDDLKQAIVNTKLTSDYNLVSLLIGVNNFYQGKTAERYKTEFEELLNMAIKLAGNNKSAVFVVSIPDYGYTPFGLSDQKNISAGIDAFNAVSREITAKHGVAYFDITDISRRGLADSSLIADDGLHPSGKMYSDWVTLILSGLSVGNRKSK